MTAAERLIALTGASGTAAERWMRLAAGVTTGAVLVAFSGMASATAAQHLLATPAALAAPTNLVGGGVHYHGIKHGLTADQVRAQNDLIMMTVIAAVTSGMLD